MHLVGFIIRIYHDARSPERQNYADVNTFDESIIMIMSNVKYMLDVVGRLI